MGECMLYQEFVLEKSKGKNDQMEYVIPPEAAGFWSKIVVELVKKGFRVLYSMDLAGGYPLRVLVGMSSEMVGKLQPKNEFYQMLNYYQVPYSSGVVFTENVT